MYSKNMNKKLIGLKEEDIYKYIRIMNTLDKIQ